MAQPTILYLCAQWKASIHLEHNFRVNLVIDRGNTQLKFGIFDQHQLVTSDYTNFLDKEQISKLKKEYGISKAILSSVVSENNDELFATLSNELNYCLELTHETKLPFTWNYTTKATIGKDRLAAVAGGITLYPDTNLLIFDAGTAMTYEIVEAGGLFLGGNISPGMQMRFKALNAFTSKLPLCAPDKDAPLIGTSTNEAITAGVQNSIAFEIDGLITTLQALHSPLTTLLTGGDAEFFARKLKNPIFVIPNLVLIGLNRILEHNA